MSVDFEFGEQYVTCAGLFFYESMASPVALFPLLFLCSTAFSFLVYGKPPYRRRSLVFLALLTTCKLHWIEIRAHPVRIARTILT